MMNDARRQKVIDMITPIISKAVANEGKILEAGWDIACAGMYKQVTDPTVLNLMHECYMGGAQHLFSTIMQALSEGNEVSDGDEAMMNSVLDELEAWYAVMAEKYLGPANDKGAV